MINKNLNPDYALESPNILLMLVSWVFAKKLVNSIV